VTTPSFTAEASLYPTSQHYGFAGVSTARRLRSLIPQQLCRHSGQSCGGIDLFLLSRIEVYGGVRRARHLRARLLPLLAVYQRSGILLPTSRFWRSLFCSALYYASIILLMN